MLLGATPAAACRTCNRGRVGQPRPGKKSPAPGKPSTHAEPPSGHLSSAQPGPNGHPAPPDRLATSSGPPQVHLSASLRLASNNTSRCSPRLWRASATRTVSSLRPLVNRVKSLPRFPKLVPREPGSFPSCEDAIPKWALPPPQANPNPSPDPAVRRTDARALSPDDQRRRAGRRGLSPTMRETS